MKMIESIYIFLLSDLQCSVCPALCPVHRLLHDDQWVPLPIHCHTLVYKNGYKYIYVKQYIIP